MTDYEAFLAKTHKNLSILQEREAKYASNAPLDLLNQIDDHKQAITLTRRAIEGEISEADWQEAIKPLNLSLASTTIFQTVIQSVPTPLIIGAGVVLLGICTISVIVLGLGIANVEPVRMALFPKETPINPEPTKDRRLYNVEIEGQDNNVVVAYNSIRQTLWQHEIDTTLLKAIVNDIDQDGSPEVFVGTHEPGKRPGWLLVFNEAGNLLDEHNIWKSPIYYGGSKPQVNIADFQIVDLTSDGTKEIVVIARDVYWYASRLVVLQFDNKRLKEVADYWNPGLLYTLHIADTNHDGVKEVICTGVNNDLQNDFPLGGNVYAIFALNGSAISGQAPPGYGQASNGSEIWYGYVMPPEIRIGEVDFEDVNGDGQDEIHVSLSDACSYYLNDEGNIVGRGRGTACKNESELHLMKFWE